MKEWLKNKTKSLSVRLKFLRWLYEKRVTSFDEMSNLSKELREN
ncbi:hypothetical protein ACEQPO_12690 [Bacillus sp. SL00103]